MVECDCKKKIEKRKRNSSFFSFFISKKRKRRREKMQIAAYVLSKKGIPLMPAHSYGKVRRLLKSKR